MSGIEAGELIGVDWTQPKPNLCRIKSVFYLSRRLVTP